MALGKPTNINKTASTHKSFTLTWDAATDATGYKIIATEIDGNDAPIGTPIEKDVGTALTGTVDSLKPNTRYLLQVEATDGTNKELSTNSIKERTDDIPKLATPVPTLSNVDWAGTPNPTAKVSWTVDSNAGHYEVQVNTETPVTKASGDTINLIKGEENIVKVTAKLQILRTSLTQKREAL